MYIYLLISLEKLVQKKIERYKMSRGRWIIYGAQLKAILIEFVEGPKQRLRI
jgi:hypothetical protein